MHQSQTEELRSLLKDLLAARDEQKCVQRTLTEIDYFDRVEKRYEFFLLIWIDFTPFRNTEWKALDTRSKLVGFRDLNIELGEIYKMSVNAEKVMNYTVDTKVNLSIKAL